MGCVFLVLEEVKSSREGDIGCGVVGEYVMIRDVMV